MVKCIVNKNLIQYFIKACCIIPILQKRIYAIYFTTAYNAICSYFMPGS